MSEVYKTPRQFISIVLA